MLKALGAKNSFLYRTVLVQAVLSLALGLGLSLAFTLLLAALVPKTSAGLILEVSLGSLFKVSALSLVIAGISALLPIRQIVELDPALVFRSK